MILESAMGDPDIADLDKGPSPPAEVEKSLSLVAISSSGSSAV
jgi:hypothetical protein